ncbi:MAG: formylmethanofuran dehydrogenase [Desulfobacteraceae bacterium]|nr:formylmethanofuran dehydrogenase [Desulfobacteraceae bacterium]
MICSLDKNSIKKTIEFHGHNCPGLSIGIRASELAMEELNIQNAAAPVCVTETDMCGVDAIQFLTGCTFGKGNMIHRDYGKSAFTFYDREAKKGIRAVFNDNLSGSSKAEVEETRLLMAKVMQGTATKEEETIAMEKRAQRIEQIMTASLSDLFTFEEIDTPPARPARILKSIECDTCGEMTMESRVKLFDGKNMCKPCFQKVEQKI